MISSVLNFFKSKSLNKKDVTYKPGAALGHYRDPSYSRRSGDSRSGGSKFDYGLSGTRLSRTLDHFSLRQQARDAYHDTPQAKAMVDRFADTVADVGLKLEAAPKADVLGLSQKEAEEWSMEVQEKFDLWCRSKTCHRSETMNFYQAQRLYAIQQQRDNDQFVRLFYSKDKRLVSPLQFEFYDPNQIRGHAWTSTYAQTSLSDGILRDARGVEKSFKVWYLEINPNGHAEYKNVDVPAKTRGGLPLMLHGFYSEYPGQRRGYSRLSHSLQEFENITDFSLASVKKAIALSSFVMAVENKDQDPSSPLEGLERGLGGVGPFSENLKSSSFSDDDVNQLTETPSYTPIPEAAFNTPGAAGVFNLQRGDELKMIGDKTAMQSYDRFVDSFTSHLAASNGMPLEVMMMKFSSNYSASRASLILFWRIAQIWQHEMASDFLNPTYESWLTTEISEGRMAAPGWSDPRLRAAWCNCDWIGAPMPNIDPQKTANADRAYAELGATTLGRIARNYNGSSAEANRAKLRREYAETPEPPWQKWTDVDEPEEDED